jgi:hypothetical protein
MKRCVCILLAGLFVNQFAVAADPLILHDGTPIRMRLGQNLSSGDAKVGESVDFEVLDELVVDGTLLIPRGGVASATVTEAQSKGRMARGGKLDVNIDFVRLANGEKVALRAVKESKGGGYTGAMTVGTVAPTTPLSLFKTGKDVAIPKGTEITAYVNGEIKLDREKLSVAPAPAANPAPETAVPVVSASTAPPPAAKRRAASIAISSDPASADIELNGKFIGNTPSTVEIPPGPTNITVKKSGFRFWSRTLDLSEGASISLRAELERETPNIVFVRPAK